MSAQQADNRRQILKLVRKIWIDDYLQHSLDNLARLELGLEENPDAVSRPWDAIVQQPDRAPRPLPPGQTMGAVFDELGQALLILGAPGAGKTTLLLELTRDLLDRAEQDASYPMPVVFHLSTWAVRRHPLADWLVDELVSPRYYVPRELARAWIDADQILPLLDGLDEVAPEHRAECVEVINTFRRRHGLVPLAVCCRKVDYEALPTRMAMSGAVAIEPLSRTQVSTYLKQAGKALAGVRTALREDETLWELLDTPLMLSIVALAYRGRLAAEVRATGSLEERRAHLFANYTERMFERRTKITEYTREQTIRWLAWLARSLMHNNLSIFYVEWMQPDWLPSRAQRWIVAMIPVILFGLGSGLIGGLFLGLLGGLLGGLAGGLDRITPAELLRWSWRRARHRCAAGLGVGLAGGLFFGPAFELVGELGVGMGGGVLRNGLGVGLGGGLAGGLLGGLLGGLSTDQIVARTIPNEGIRRSLRCALFSLLIAGLVGGLVSGLVVELIFGDALELLDTLSGGLSSRVRWLVVGRSGFQHGLGIGLIFGLGVGLVSGLGGKRGGRRSGGLVFALVSGLVFALVGWLIGWLVGWLIFELASWLYFKLGVVWLHEGLVVGLAVGLIFGLALGLWNGGSAYLKHYVLRILLWRNGYAPLNYIRFLDYAAERVFLRKVGGGYIFTHRLLMEYFATLGPIEQTKAE